MRFDESPARLPAETIAGASVATEAWHTLTMDASAYRADAVASEALIAREAIGAPVIGVSTGAEPVRLTVTF